MVQPSAARPLRFDSLGMVSERDPETVVARIEESLSSQSRILAWRPRQIILPSNFVSALGSPPRRLHGEFNPPSNWAPRRAGAAAVACVPARGRSVGVVVRSCASAQRSTAAAKLAWRGGRTWGWLPLSSALRLLPAIDQVAAAAYPEMW